MDVKLGSRLCRISDDEIRIPLPRLLGRGYLFDRKRQVVLVSRRLLWDASYIEVPFSNINFITVKESFYDGRGDPGQGVPDVSDSYVFEILIYTNEIEREISHSLQFSIGKASFPIEQGGEPVKLIATAIGRVTGRPVIPPDKAMDSSPPPQTTTPVATATEIVFDYYAYLITEALHTLAGIGGAILGWWTSPRRSINKHSFERDELIWTVTGKSVRAETDDNGVTHYCYSLQVEHRRFSVDERIYNSVSEGEEVVVTFKRRSYVIATVRKLRAETTPADIEA